MLEFSGEMDMLVESFEFVEETDGDTAVSERSDGNRVERFERTGPITQQPPDAILVERIRGGTLDRYTMKFAPNAGRSSASGGGPDGPTGDTGHVDVFIENGFLVERYERSDSTGVMRFERRGPRSTRPTDSIFIERTRGGTVERYMMQRTGPAGSGGAPGCAIGDSSQSPQASAGVSAAAVVPAGVAPVAPDVVDLTGSPRPATSVAQPSALVPATPAASLEPEAAQTLAAAVAAMLAARHGSGVLRPARALACNDPACGLCQAAARARLAADMLSACPPATPPVKRRRLCGGTSDADDEGFELEEGEGDSSAASSPSF